MSGHSTLGTLERTRSHLVIALSVSVVAHAILVTLVGKQPQYLLAKAPGAIEIRIVPVTSAGVGHTDPVVEATESVLIDSSGAIPATTDEADAGSSSRQQEWQVAEARATSQRPAADVPAPTMEEPAIATPQAPPPSDTTYYAESEVDSIPVALETIVPQYPFNSAVAKSGGMVKLRVLIDESGVVAEVVVVEASPPEVFDQSARDALTKTRFKPAEKDGKPVWCVTMVSIGYAGSEISAATR